jgi:hypothetical protein
MPRDFSVLLDVPKVKSDREFSAVVEQICGPECMRRWQRRAVATGVYTAWLPRSYSFLTVLLNSFAIKMLGPVERHANPVRPNVKCTEIGSDAGPQFSHFVAEGIRHPDTGLVEPRALGLFPAANRTPLMGGHH